MKPFNLEKAKSGTPVITTTGIPVRFLCWDRRVGEYTCAVYLEITEYSDRLISHPIHVLNNYLRMKV